MNRDTIDKFLEDFKTLDDVDKYRYMRVIDKEMKKINDTCKEAFINDIRTHGYHQSDKFTHNGFELSTQERVSLEDPKMFLRYLESKDIPIDNVVSSQIVLETAVLRGLCKEYKITLQDIDGVKINYSDVIKTVK